jgi:hypothetical protein
MNDSSIDLEKIDIRVFNTVSGRQLVGEYLDTFEGAVYIGRVLEAKRILLPDNNFTIGLITATPYDESNPLILNINSIESETVASSKLKRIYLEQLVINIILSLVPKESSDFNSVEQTNLTTLDQQDYWQYFKDKMMQ